LNFELLRLKRLFNYGHELSLRWLPGHVKFSSGRKISGQVQGNIIYIFDEREDDALATLLHEFVEYALVEELITPYKHVINGLISIIEEYAYGRRQRLVKRLCDIVSFGKTLAEESLGADENGSPE
jgi:hypothetical protein